MAITTCSISKHITKEYMYHIPPKPKGSSHRALTKWQQLGNFLGYYEQDRFYYFTENDRKGKSKELSSLSIPCLLTMYMLEVKIKLGLFFLK